MTHAVVLRIITSKRAIYCGDGDAKALDIAALVSEGARSLTVVLQIALMAAGLQWWARRGHGRIGRVTQLERGVLPM